MLTVITIISILAALLLPTLLRAKDSAQDTTTKKRIGQVEDGLRMAFADNSRVKFSHPRCVIFYSDQEALRFEPLRAVISHLTQLDTDPLVLHDMQQVALFRDKDDKLNDNIPLPPNLASIYDTNIGNLPQKIRGGEGTGHGNRGTKTVASSSMLNLANTWYAVRDDPVQGIGEFSATLDRVILFEDLQSFTNDLAWFTVSDGSASNYCQIDNFGTTTGTPYPFWVIDTTTKLEQSFWWCHRGLIAIGSGSDGSRYDDDWDPSAPNSYEKDAASGAYNRHYGWDSRITFNLETTGDIDTETSTGNVLAWRTLFTTKPVNGETLDQTFEIMPRKLQKGNGIMTPGQP